MTHNGLVHYSDSYPNGFVYSCMKCGQQTYELDMSARELKVSDWTGITYVSHIGACPNPPTIAYRRPKDWQETH